MAEPILSAEYFHNEESAYELVESKLWPKGKQVCPHCAVISEHYKLQGEKYSHWYLQVPRLPQAVYRQGWHHFRVQPHSAAPLVASGIFLIASSKKGISANQLHRTLGITLKSAWFMAHRVREAMRDNNIGGLDGLGGAGKTVEADETYVGGKEKNKHRNKRDPAHIGGAGKEAVFSLVERKGRVRSHHVADVKADNLRPILKKQLADAAKTKFMTDGEGQYRLLAPMFKSHEAVNHGIGEYVRGDAHTNTIEVYFSILKRGITGVYHHVSGEHLKRYLGEFDFRYNNRTALGVDDAERAERLLQGVVGKRLTYATPAG